MSGKQTSKKMSLGVVVSVYNEAEGLLRFHEKLIAELKKLKEVKYEVVYVNDGSEDGSREILNGLVKKNKKVRSVHLARNFGHEAAMLAGMERVSAEMVVCMDGDLQHPPRDIGRLVKEFNKGAEVVLGKRSNDAETSWWRRWLTRGYYRLYNRMNQTKLERNVTDFFLVSKKVSRIVCQEYGERRRFLRAILQSLGFKKVYVTFRAPKRKWGKSKYGVQKLADLSLHSLLSFSPFALYVCLAASGGFALLSVGLAVFSVVMKFLLNPVSGYTTLIVFLSGLAAVQFLVLGLVSYYLSIVVEEVKKRPMYVVEEEF